MKRSIFLSCFLLLAVNSFCQDPIEILAVSREKCQSISNGYYEMARLYKNMSDPDTVVSSSKCYFTKSNATSPFPVLFQIQYFKEGMPKGCSFFNGDELVNYSVIDSTGMIMKMDKWKREIKASSDTYDFFTPFISRNGSPLPEKSSFRKNTFHVKWLGEETLNNVKCHHIETRELAQIEKGVPLEVLDFVRNYWINSEDLLPVQFSETFTMVMNMDTVVQYEMFTLEHYDIKSPFDVEKISLAGVPSYIKLKEYTVYFPPKPLPLDTIAPAWTFSSISGETVSLEGLKGKLVLLDFFFKACMPCIQAMPGLQSLHEKYKEKGLVVIGLNPFDSKEDNLQAFIANQNVDYPVLYASKEIAETYRVSGYPTMYLLDQSGRVLYVEQGFGEGVEAKLEEIIVKNLK